MDKSARGSHFPFADGLAERGIASLRYQFPYMEQGSTRPDVFRTRGSSRPKG